MLAAFAFIAGAGLMRAASGVVFGHAIKAGTPTRLFFASSMTLCALGSWAFVTRWGVLFEDGLPAEFAAMCLAMIAAGAFNACGQVALMTALRRGPRAVCFTLAQCSMVLSFLFAAFVWGEPMAWRHYAGVAVVVASVGLLADSAARAPQRGRASGVWFALGAMTAWGASQVCFMTPSQWAGWSDAARLRLPISVTATALIFVALGAVARLRPDVTALRLGAVQAVIFGLHWVFIFGCLDLLEARRLTGIVFPLAVGVSVVAFALYCALALRERFTFRRLAGILLGALGILSLAWR